MILSIKRILNDNMEKVTPIFPVSLESRETGTHPTGCKYDLQCCAVGNLLRDESSCTEARGVGLTALLWTTYL